MAYFDSTLTVGYYDAFGVDHIDHTYALVAHGSDTYAFPCYGDFATSTSGPGARGNVNVKYPVDMWTPYMIGSQNVGSHRPASLFVALGMAQFRFDPAYNWRVQDWPEGSQIGGVACWGGIVYGVSGVCQQVCNRVLWSTVDNRFNETPVNWPPTFSATYWVYGYYGKTTEEIAARVAFDLVKLAPFMPIPQTIEGNSGFANRAAQPGAEAQLLDIQARHAAALRESLRQPMAAPERQLEIQHLIEVSQAQAEPTAFARAAPAYNPQAVLARDTAFRVRKTELDILLLRGEVSRDEYATQVNQAFQHLLAELQDIMPPVVFDRLFPEYTAARPVVLVNREQMPESYDLLPAKLML
ncbi:hypothetical protein [Hymenobacter baengnokdamensis]|uniref:hypothetical protein n=1 Tax=Hymenobacter baengnokdamensis TaxID=2615203 RepID=UPI0012483523|nr:hypothetical protein [Hymenobacter baengnokdamensis]